MIRRAYGPYSGFVIGWADWLTYAADLALKAVVIIEFVAILLPEAATWSTALAIIVTTVFAAIQLRGIGLGALIQEVATSMIGLVISYVVRGHEHEGKLWHLGHRRRHGH